MQSTLFDHVYYESPQLQDSMEDYVALLPYSLVIYRSSLKMKLSLSLLAWSALSLCSSIQAASSSSQQLTPRQAKFHSLASKNNGIVSLSSSQQYDELIQDTPSSPRDYSVSIILTALNPKYGCQPCISFDKEHKEVAYQWWTNKENKKEKVNQMRHIFAVLDFEKGQEIFKRVGSYLLCPGSSYSPLTRCNCAMPVARVKHRSIRSTLPT